DRYNATASALNSGGYDFIATWNSLSPDFHHPVLKVSTLQGEGPTSAFTCCAQIDSYGKANPLTTTDSSGNMQITHDPPQISLQPPSTGS
ncbi:hypothetical protein, partial [Nonomuraea bangladeshensis]|uniref:hypothetical protein n=1 Tax=Nonomuraea bangladeshensis TaxID=404385 RepID=UPI0031CF2360